LTQDTTAKSLKISTAKVISLVANPVIILLFSTTLVSLMRSNQGLLPLFLAGFLPPLIAYVYLLFRHRKHFESYASIPRADRPGIYISGLYSFSLIAIFFFVFQNFTYFYDSILIALFLGIMFLVNYYFDKASMHASAYAFSIVYLASTIHIAVLCMLALLPLILWSRIVLHKHTLRQLAIGSIIGLIIGSLSFLISF
jgi:hypothetical protein